MNASELAYWYRHGRGPLFGSSSGTSDPIDLVDEAVDRVEHEVYGLEVGAGSEVFGSKEDRLDRLEERLLALEEKAEDLDGRKKSRIDKKIARVKKKIARLQRKLGIEPDDDESMGAHYFVPIDQDDHSDPGVLGVRRPGAFGLDPGYAASLREFSSRWLGRAGVVQIRDDVWREGPVIVVSTVHGLRPSGMPRRFSGYRVVVVRGTAASPHYVFGADVPALASRASSDVSTWSKKALQTAGRSGQQAFRWTGGAVKTLGKGALDVVDWAGRAAGNTGRFVASEVADVRSRRAGRRASSLDEAASEIDFLTRPSEIQATSFGDVGDAVADEMFGSVPFGPDEGPYQLWPADAATADEGTILAVPIVPDHPLGRAAHDGAVEGVELFLRERARSGPSPR